MSFKFWLGIIMCYGADIRMKPGPQRGTLVIGTRACAKSIRFFVSEKNKSPNILLRILPQTLRFGDTHKILEFAFM